MKSAIALILCMVLSEGANTLFKLGVDKMKLDLRPETAAREVVRLATNPYILAGFVAYAGGFLLWMGVLRRFQYSTASLFFSLHYVLMLVIAVVVFKEDITLMRGVGAALIIGGVTIVSRT